jgi:hypothetical protein
MRFPSGILQLQDALMEGRVYYFESKEKGLCALKYERHRYKLFVKTEEKPFASYEHINDAVVKVLSLTGMFI